MVLDWNDDFIKPVKRGSGILVYIPKTLLVECGVDVTDKLRVKRYRTKKKSVILEFKETD